MKNPIPTDRPNIIQIIPHDLGDYLGCYGHTVHTPNLDSLAREGVRFANHFCTSPLCSPARGSIITGMYPHTNGLMGLVNCGWDMPARNITDAQRFAEAGYRTCLIGFQHEKQSVGDLGFHEFYNSYIACNNYSNDVIGDIASQLLKRFAAQKAETVGTAQPFYIRIGMFSTHFGVPHVNADGGYDGYDWAYGRGIDESRVDVLPQWMDTPGLRRDLAGFTGEVNNLDRGIGLILEALKNCGLENNTLVVFVPDHGISFPRGKCTLYDLGIRTACIIRYPEMFKSGTTIDALTSHVDILPTLLDVCGITRTPGIEGASMVPLIQGANPAIHDAVFAEESTFSANIMRCVRTDRYKLIHNFSTGVKSNAAAIGGSRTVEGTGRFYFADRPEYEFYDMSSDPNELTNLAGTGELRETESRLKEKLNNWLLESGDPVLCGGVKRPPDEEAIINALPHQYHNEHYVTLWEHLDRKVKPG